MKHYLSLAAALGLMLCAILRTDGRGSASALRSSTALETVAPVAADEPGLPPGSAPVAEVRTSGGGTASEPPRVSESAPSLEISPVDHGTEEILGRLMQVLTLTGDQVDQVREVLRDREQRLQEWHGALRSGKVFNVREYGRTLTRLIEDWYRSIDQVLDTAQHDRFQALVAEGLLSRGTEFVIDLKEMVVLR